MNDVNVNVMLIQEVVNTVTLLCQQAGISYDYTPDVIVPQCVIFVPVFTV